MSSGRRLKTNARAAISCSLPTFLAALEIVTDGVEFTELSLHANLLKPPWNTGLALPLEDGCLPVPDGPGLGVEVNSLPPHPSV